MELIKHNGFHPGYFGKAVAVYLMAGLLSKLFHAQTIKRRFQKHYISWMRYDYEGLVQQMRANFETANPWIAEFRANGS